LFSTPSTPTLHTLSLHDALPIYPAKQDALFADVVLVGIRRGVERQKRDLVPARQQLDRLRVVARARPAVHSRGSSRDRKNIHRSDRKSTRLNSSHQIISYAVFCL